MMKRLFFIALLAGLFACSRSRQQDAVLEEDRDAKLMLQGIWVDDDTEQPVWKMEGDTVFYADRSVASVAFKVMGDTLVTYGAQATVYPIEKRSASVLWLHSAVGDLVRLHKAEDTVDSLAFTHKKEVPVYDQVVKKDSVVMFNGVRYRGYVYINPSNMKVICPSVSEEGLEVDNIYYDNIIHICVYEGKKSLFAKDIRKQMFGGVVPEGFLQGAILSDMDFTGVDACGYHYLATVCIPDGASCYMIRLSITPKGEISYEMMQ